MIFYLIIIVVVILTVVESRTINVPEAALRNSAIASSREIVGLYQNFDESRAYLS